MLLQTGAVVEPIVDYNFLLHIRGSTRGGLSFVSERYFKFKADADENGCIISARLLDANSLYGGEQTKPQPSGGYRRLTPAEFNLIDWRNTDDDGPVGYMVQCNLSFPETHHALWKKLCPCPESREITWSMLR